MAARILLVEDNEANLELAKYLLEMGGHTVLTAEDGAEGLAVARREHPDLMISDLQMPVMDGYEFLRQVRLDASLKELPVIALTAFSMSGDRKKVLVAGFDGYLSKPIDPETFATRIESFLLGGRRPHVPGEQ